MAVIPGQQTEPTGTSAWNQQGWGGGFYNPWSNYGSTQYQPNEFATTPLGNMYLEDPANWDASFMRYASEMGWDPGSNRNKWLRQQFPMLDEGYRAALGTNPELRFNQYLRGVDLDGMYRSQTAQQRGENPGQYAPRARTISRGY